VSRSCAAARLNDPTLSRRLHRGPNLGSGTLRVDADRIKAFATEFDPQPARRPIISL
jgi:hypothetical protein